jgi:hypothetical protein
MSSTETGNYKGESGTDAHRSFPRDTCGFLKLKPKSMFLLMQGFQ